MAERSITEDLEKNCFFCEYGTPMPPDKDGNELVLCSKKGPVKEGAGCRKFSYDPLKREPARRPPLPEVKAVNIDEL